MCECVSQRVAPLCMGLALWPHQPWGTSSGGGSQGCEKNAHSRLCLFGFGRGISGEWLEGPARKRGGTWGRPRGAWWPRGGMLGSAASNARPQAHGSPWSARETIDRAPAAPGHGSTPLAAQGAGGWFAFEASALLPPRRSPLCASLPFLVLPLPRLLFPVSQPPRVGRAGSRYGDASLG